MGADPGRRTRHGRRCRALSGSARRVTWWSPGLAPASICPPFYGAGSGATQTAERLDPPGGDSVVREHSVVRGRRGGRQRTPRRHRPPPPDPDVTTVAGFARSVAATLDAIGLEERLDVVGFSFGGLVALELARSGRARTLSLVSTRAAFDAGHVQPHELFADFERDFRGSALETAEFAFEASALARIEPPFMPSCA